MKKFGLSWRFQRAVSVLTALLILALAAGFARATERVALVIGNSGYDSLPRLVNPGNDAADLARSLRDLGFDVIEAFDLTQNGMRRTVETFAEKLEPAQVGLFFYAGHAVQMAGVNYLVPIDAALDNEADFKAGLTGLDDVLAVLEQAVPTRLVFLDACRDNPLTPGLQRSLARSATMAPQGGLARIEAPAGTLIAYATSPNDTALDGQGRNSPFTAALLEHIVTPGLEARQVLTRVRQAVIATTAGDQVPWDSSSLTGEFYFKREADRIATKAARVEEGAIDPQASEERLALSATDRRELVEMLTMLGFASRPLVDRFNPRHRLAIRRWQEAAGIASTGFFDLASFSTLLAQADEVLVREARVLDGRAFAEISIDALLAADQEATTRILDLTEAYLTATELTPFVSAKLADARLGDAESPADLAWHLKDSEAHPDLHVAFTRLFAISAGRGYSAGFAALGHRYYRGRGVEKDMAKSLEMYRRAAELDDAEGYFGIGLHHQRGTGGVEPNIKLAIDHYRASAERGYWWAMVDLGDIYRSGEQTSMDQAKARLYYNQVIDGDTPAWAASAVEKARQGIALLDQTDGQ